MVIFHREICSRLVEGISAPNTYKSPCFLEENLHRLHESPRLQLPWSPWFAAAPRRGRLLSGSHPRRGHRGCLWCPHGDHGDQQLRWPSEWWFQYDETIFQIWEGDVDQQLMISMMISMMNSLTISMMINGSENGCFCSTLR